MRCPNCGCTLNSNLCEFCGLVDELELPGVNQVRVRAYDVTCAVDGAGWCAAHRSWNCGLGGL